MSNTPQPTTEPQKPLQLHQLFDIDDLIISTARYYTGRTTGATSTFALQLAHAWPQLNQYTQSIIKRDLQGAFERDDEALRIRSQGQTFKVQNWERALGSDEARLSWEAVRRAWEKEPAAAPKAPEPAPQLDMFLHEPEQPGITALGHNEAAAEHGFAS